MAEEIHVMPGKHGWEVREQGTFEPISAHPTPEDAVNAATQIARRSGAEVVVHDTDGSIRGRDRPEPEPE
jgi:Uncharacterized protein conserved in bacteria (DUF2188)